jgi:hypothetical protein
VGLFFEQAKPTQDLVDLLRTALEQAPTGHEQADAEQRAAGFAPLVAPLRDALATPPPSDAAAATVSATNKATEVTKQLLGGTTFNTGRFLVAVGIFVVLLGAAIWTDADHLKDSPTALYALATTVFGVVVGFLGAEKS